MAFSFCTLEHTLASFAMKMVQEAKVLTEKVLPALKKAAASELAIEAVTAMVAPEAVIVERAAFAILGKVVVALDDGLAASNAGGVNLALNAQEIADIKAIGELLRSKVPAAKV